MDSDDHDITQWRQNSNLQIRFKLGRTDGRLPIRAGMSMMYLSNHPQEEEDRMLQTGRAHPLVQQLQEAMV